MIVLACPLPLIQALTGLLTTSCSLVLLVVHRLAIGAKSSSFLSACPSRGPMILSVNVTSLETGWADVADRTWDVALIQEVRVVPESPVLKDIRRACCQTFLSAPDDDGTCLLAIVVRNGCVTSLDITSHPRARFVILVLWSLLSLPSVQYLCHS